MPEPPTLNIVGCGRLGTTLARLWRQHALLRLQGVANRSLGSSQAAVERIGAGTACTVADLRPAHFTLIATDDRSIEVCARAMADAGVLRAGDIVFHCSGALGSEILQPARDRGAHIASVHPIRSFAGPESAAADFSGTYCGVEGDAEALDHLNPLFTAIGARLLPLKPENKILYHAAMSIGANYLATLVQISLDTLEEAGLPPSTGLKVLEPLMRASLDNIFAMGPEAALTGPIARGDDGVVGRHLQALGAWQPDLARLYRALGRRTLQLAENRPALQSRQKQDLTKLLQDGEKD